jgi:hypothetical protein
MKALAIAVMVLSRSLSLVLAAWMAFGVLFFSRSYLATDRLPFSLLFLGAFGAMVVAAATADSRLLEPKGKLSYFAILIFSAIFLIGSSLQEDVRKLSPIEWVVTVTAWILLSFRAIPAVARVNSEVLRGS